jgi:ankyrin repeat protein
MSEIETLLKSGADANTKDIKGFSLLMSYAKTNDLDSIRTLLAYGASINDKDHLSFSALDYAIDAKNLPVVELLVRNGAKVTNDSYMFAVRKNEKSIIDYFDSLDPDKYIFLKNKNR